MDLVTFHEWWQMPENQQRFWRRTRASNGGYVGVSLGETPRKIFSQILQLLKGYHDRDVGYGNLLEGVRIDVNNQVVRFLPNPNIPPGEPFASIKKDFLDFEKLVTWVEDHIYQVTDVQPGCSSSKFHELCRLLDGDYYYRTVGQLRRFGFFMRNNQLFLNETAKYLFFKKVLTIKEFGVLAFRANVELPDIQDWAGDVQKPHLVVVRDFNPNNFTYRRPDGSIVFFRNCFGHVRFNNVVDRYDDAKILLALEDDLPKVIPVWFYALVRLDLDRVRCRNMCGYGWMEFLSMQPSVFT